jgi:uncharacterized membrane protein YgcG
MNHPVLTPPSTLPLAWCLLALASQVALAQVPELELRGSVTRFQAIEEVIQAWRPNRHVFVKGDVGVGQRQLDELQNWISQQAPNWTVVLMESAANESYRAADGREYHGLDAVEHALGHGLSNRTGFGSLEHPQTGESHGAVFVLFLRERKFSYFGSVAQDRRELGEAQWMGQLDQPAFRAMRDGGRIIDAAKDTLRTIDAQLSRAIASEAASAERAERERERAAAQVRRGLDITRQRIQEVQLAAANFRIAHPTATGPLAVPLLAEWQTEIEAIEQELNPETARQLDQRLAKLNDAVERQLNGYSSFNGLAQRQQSIERELAALAKSPAGVAKAEVSQAKKLLEQAAQYAQRGDLGIEESLAGASAAAQAGKLLVEQETAQLQRDAQRRVWIRRSVLLTLGLVAIAIAGLLALLNRRRRPALLKAQHELAQRESSVAEETDGINTIFVHSEDLLGSPEQLAKRGYEGLTQQTSRQALNYVDDLFIMSREIRRVVGEAKELVYPTSLTGRLVNLFSSDRYQQAINQVSGKPLVFNRLHGLPAVLRDQIQLNRDGSVPEEISLTFEDVFKAFKQRGADARQTLETIEASLTGIGEAISQLQIELQQIMASEKELTQAAANDRYFSLPRLFDSLIPAIQRDLDTADQQAAFDAVQAMQITLPAARRKITETAAVVLILKQARTQQFPVLTQASEQLQQLGYASSWIDDELLSMTATADQLMEVINQRSVASETEELSAALGRLQATAERAVNYAQSIEGELLPNLQVLSDKIEQGRHSLADKLQTSVSQVLNEVERDPDDWLALAGKHLGAAQASLNLGRNPLVEAALEAMQGAAERTEQLLQASQTALEHYPERAQQARTELERLMARLPGVTRELEPVQAAYEESALLMTDVENAVSNAQAAPLTAAAMISQAAAPTTLIESWLHQAASAQAAGQVLAAEDLLHEAAETLTLAHQRLDSVQQHLQRVATQATQNQTTLGRLHDQITLLMRATADPLVMQPTLDRMAQTQLAIQAWRRDLTTSQVARNPFEVQQDLVELGQSCQQLESQCIADRQAHAEAARALAGATRQLPVAQELVQQSQTDGIPDSQAIVEANRRIAALAQQLTSLQRELDTPHASWKHVDEHSSRIQAELRAAADSLSGELQNAGQALTNFQLASQAVYQAEQWSGAYGIRVGGSPGVSELQRARQGLEQGNYGLVLELAKLASTMAQGAVQQAEREVTRRRMAEQQAAEAERRRRTVRNAGSPFGGGFNMGSGKPFGGGSFGGGRSFGGGGSSSSKSSGGNSGFGRSGW